MAFRFRRLALLVAAFAWSLSASAPNVLSNTAHAATDINSAINTLLPGVLDVTILTDETSTDNGLSFLSPAPLISAARDTGRTNFKVADGTTRNSAPYAIVTQSSTGYSLSIDQSSYTSLYNSGTNPVLYNYAQVFPTAGVSPPPVAMTNIIAPPATNPNSGLGGGTEFVMSAGYKGFPTQTSSGTTAAFAGVLAALMQQHPSFNMWDIKASLRQTASKWATGWNSDYGNIDYDSANAIASTGALYLQPPNLTAVSAGSNRLSLTVYPFRQSRRHHEEVYLVPSGYSWPIKNEYTTADLTAAHSTLIFTGNTSDVIPSGTVSFAVTPGLYDLIAFTTDNAGNYSRVEIFSKTGVSDQCL